MKSNIISMSFGGFDVNIGMRKNKLLLITGSLYLVLEIMAIGYSNDVKSLLEISAAFSISFFL
jgi:hypothetical protein